jgi:CRP/FNR family transcriptional regulator
MQSIADIIQDLPRVHIPAGQVIFHQGQVCESYFVLVEGSAKVVARSAAGKEVVLYHVRPGAICVLTTACLLGRENFPAEAIAETDLTLHLMPRHRFDELLDSSAAFRAKVFASFGERMTELIKTIEKVALESIEQRLARFLLLQPCAHVELTHQDLALEIGSVREVVSRQLKRFEAQGWLRLGRGALDILDRDALYRLI